jgi:uncharacterized protein
VKVVFADTFYWAALVSTEDAAHERAVAISRELEPEKIVTTDEVLCELLAFFSSARSSVRAEAGRQVADLIVNPDVLVVPQSRESFLLGLELYRARPDKRYSLVDCKRESAASANAVSSASPLRSARIRIPNKGRQSPCQICAYWRSGAD